MRKPIYALAALTLIVSLLLAACARPAPSPTSPAAPTTPPPTTAPAPKVSPVPTPPLAETPQYGGVLRVPGPVTPRSLIPETNIVKNWFNMAAYDTLLRVDEKGELAPWLATDWKLSPDNKSLTLNLRKGVKFHDGTDFNAAAVKFNIDLRKAAKLGDYQTVTSVDVIEDYTARLNFSQFENTVFSSLWFIAGLMHSPTAYQNDGKDNAKWHPVGTGPFKFVSYEQSTIAKFERFDGYWQKGKPYLNGFEHVVISDATTRELALRKGEIQASDSVEARLVPELEKEGFAIITAPVETYNVAIFDSANADSPFAKKKVREAVEYAIDRAAVVKALGYGRWEALTQMTPAGTYAYTADIKGRSYDPAKAKKLLEEAGYPVGFKTTILLRDNLKDDWVAVQRYLKEVGIEATIDVADAGRFINAQQKGWNNGLMHRALRVPPDWLQYIYTTLSATSNDSKSLLRPPEFEALMKKALAAPDMSAKRAASQEVVKMMFDEAMVVPLWGSLSTLAYRKNVHNLGYYLPWGPNKLWGPAEVWFSK
ncbi:MAG: ABC transporter substrate-binding protein [Chloroflexi bacterium]|nr:ABC transporter substrate-binding protein [Chloroflexota bacterium]